MRNKVKLTFELLEQEMEIFSKEEQRGFMGGTDTYTWQQFVDAYNNGNLSQIEVGSYIMGSSGNMIYGGDMYGGELNNVNIYVHPATSTFYYKGQTYSFHDPHSPFYNLGNDSIGGGSGGGSDWGNYNGFGGPGSPIQLNEIVIGGSHSNSLGAFQLGWDTKTLLTEIALGGRTLTTAEANYLKYLTGVGNLANAASAGLTVYDAIDQGLQTHHVADLFVQAAIYDIALGVPVVGWIIGGAYFIGDEYFKNTHNGKSITEYYLDRP